MFDLLHYRVLLFIVIPSNIDVDGETMTSTSTVDDDDKEMLTMMTKNE